MIVAENLVKSYRGNSVLQGLSFEAAPGEVTLLVGSNGAGKTTTLRILSGVSRPDAGGVKISGVDLLLQRKNAQEHLSFLPQSVSFHPGLTCRQVVRFYARLRRQSRARADEMLAVMGLEAEAEKSTRLLSGGLRQRLGLAVLLLPDADALLLDEPGLSLDPEWRERLQGLLRDEAGRGKTILVTTHLLAEWEGAADRCLLCREGKLDRELDPILLRQEFAHQAKNTEACP